MQRNVVLLAPKTKPQMNFFAQFIPQYLLTKRSLTIMVTSAAAFAFLFIIIYEPFKEPHWDEIPRFIFVACVLGIVLLGMSIVAISRVIMCYHAKKHPVTYLKYGAWVFVELVLMAVAFSVCSTLVGTQQDIWENFEKSLLYTSLILLIPYIVNITAFTLQDRNRRLREIEDDMDKAMQQRAANTMKGLISFYDERGELQLSVTKDNLLYIESADNYMYIWYMKGNLPKKLMLRNTLKRTAELLGESNVMRCHRGYMVNMEQVKVLRREKENFYLELGIEGVKDIPVSKTYGDAVLKWLSMW